MRFLLDDVRGVNISGEAAFYIAVYSVDSFPLARRTAPLGGRRWGAEPMNYSTSTCGAAHKSETAPLAQNTINRGGGALLSLSNASLGL